MDEDKPKVIPPASVADILGNGAPAHRVMGATIYDHKTGGAIQQVSEASLKRFRKDTDYKGYKSCLNFDKESDIIEERYAD